MRIIVFVLCVLIPTPCFGVVLFSDDFDDSDDWTVTQPSGSAANCTSSCGVPGGWDMYRNGVCLCGAEISGEPGNNLFYIDQYSGYPNETNACRGSTGKCLSMWSESCSDVYDQSDGILSVDLGDEYSDIYVRFYIKFKPNWELRGLIGDDGPIQKFLHIQHYDPVESANPYIYHDASDPNEPVGVLQTGQYTTTIKMNGVARCNPD